MNNLFSVFDPSSSILAITFSYNWLICIMIFMLLPVNYFLMSNQNKYFLISMMNFISNELSSLFGPMITPGVIMWTMSYFFFIILSNVTGLLPYVFTSTSHVSMTLTLALPFWMGSMLFSILTQWNSIFSHMVPLGTPVILMPVMVIIETVSNIIRPFTLAIRLAANMTAGHLLLALLGGNAETAPMLALSFIMMGFILLMMLECAVACIQAYVFCVLNSLYLNELMSLSFNKVHYFNKM